MTDGLFLALQRKASRNDTFYFTENQLYSALAARPPSRVTQGVAGVLFVVGAVAGVSASVNGEWLAALLVTPIMWLFGWFSLAAAGSVPNRAALEQLVNKWLAAGRDMPRLIRAPALTSPAGPYRENDLFDYGVERIIVVDEDLLVDLLVRNNLHADHRALVISAGGYPRHLRRMAHNLLQQRPDIPVILLHGSGDSAGTMAAEVHASPHLSHARNIVDAGLFEHQVHASRRLKRAQQKAGSGPLPLDALTLPTLTAGLAGIAAFGITDFAEAAERQTTAGGGGDFG